MTTPSTSAPDPHPIPAGCLCRHVDGTIGHVHPDARVGIRTSQQAQAMGLYRLDVHGTWRLDVPREELTVLSFDEAQDHERRQRAAAKARRAIAAMRAAPDFDETLPMWATKRRRPAVIDAVCEVVS